MRGELPEDQAARNAANALRALYLERTAAKKIDREVVAVLIRLGEYEVALKELAKIEKWPSAYCPHPLCVVAAEIRNAIRYQ